MAVHLDATFFSKRCMAILHESIILQTLWEPKYWIDLDCINSIRTNPTPLTYFFAYSRCLSPWFLPDDLCLYRLVWMFILKFPVLPELSWSQQKKRFASKGAMFTTKNHRGKSWNTKNVHWSRDAWWKMDDWNVFFWWVLRSYAKTSTKEEQASRSTDAAQLP